MIAQKIVKYIFFFFVFILLVGTVFFGIQWFSDGLGNLRIQGNGVMPASLQTSFSNAQVQAQTSAPSSLPSASQAVSDLTIGATSAISIAFDDDQSEVLFQKDAQEKLPIASLTKLMTAVVVLDNYDLSKKITIDASAMGQEGEQGDLKLGQVLSVENLLYITLMESSNRSAYALSELAGTDKFLALMNEDTQKMGLTNTHFEDATGLNSGSYSTAQDLFKLSEYLFKNYPLFSKIISLKEYNLYLDDGTFHHKLINTNQLLGADNVIGGKTGFTNDAKGCFMVIQKSPNGAGQHGNYVINIVLGSDDRFADMQTIIDWINKAYAW